MHRSLTPTTVGELFEFAAKSGLLVNGKLDVAYKHREYETLCIAIRRIGKELDEEQRAAFEEEDAERKLGVMSNTLDYGQDDYVDVSTDKGSKALRDALLDRQTGLDDYPTCFAIMCETMGVSVGPTVKSCSELTPDLLAALNSKKDICVAIDAYGIDDKRNHVVPTYADKSRTGTVNYAVVGSGSMNNVTRCVTSAQEFFNKGGRFYFYSFYADDPVAQVPDMSDFSTSFGGGRTAENARNNPPPRSVNNDDSQGGSANVGGGVVRARRRVVKAKGKFDMDIGALRGYAVAGTTMFNNVDELYLDTISRDYAQEILEDLFTMWGLPSEDPVAMQFAEDLVWAFIVARTASNKAVYDAEFDVPANGGSILVNFNKLSKLLADKYGLTRRNFARGVANDIKAYLLRPENQFVRSRSAQRVNADPQYGHFCFDGSTGCTDMTSSEVTFCRVLEARNLYERDDVIAEGASDRLMQGIHGGVRSKVAR